MAKWVKNKKEKVSPSALSTPPSTFTSLHIKLSSRRKLPRPFLKLETWLPRWWRLPMSESTPSSTNLSGIKVSETCPEESESESQERDLKKRDHTNGIHLFNMLMSNPLAKDSLKRLKSQHDLHTLFKLSHFSFCGQLVKSYSFGNHFANIFLHQL